MEKEAGAQNNNSEVEICFCLTAENVLHEKKNLLSVFICCICQQIYTTDVIFLCWLNKLNIEVSEICDTVFDF